MAGDEEIGRERLDHRAQNQQALLEDGQALREVIQELRASKEERREQEGRIVELSELIISLNAQVKGKGKKSDPTPEPSATAAGARNGGNRPPPPQQAAPGAPGGGDSDDNDDDEKGPEKGRRDERPTRKEKGPEENEEEDEATWDELRFSRALGKAIGDTTKQPGQPPPEYEHAKHQDVRFWLTACKDFFDRNPYQWQDEADRIKYALSKLKGPQVSAFAMTYRNQMTGELGYSRQEGYELWDIFTEPMVRRFGPIQEEEKALQQMMKVRYKGDIDQFLLEIDNWNIKVKVTGVVLRKLIEDQIPEEAISRLSMIDSIPVKREWLEAVRTGVPKEEDFQEGRKLKYPDSSGSSSSGKRKRNEPTAAVIKKPKYTAKEKRVYQAKRKEERAAKKPAAHRQKIMHRVWADAHTGIDQKEIDDWKAKEQCTGCTLTNHGWNQCKKEIRISTIQRKPFKLLVGRSKPPRPRKLRVAAVADHSQGEISQQAGQRPLAWTNMEDDDP